MSRALRQSRRDRAGEARSIETEVARLDERRSPDGLARQRVWTGTLASIRLTVGSGCLATLGEAVERLGGRRPLLVTDPGLRAATDHVDRALASLAGAGVEASLFDGLTSNPTSRQVELGSEAARAHGCDLLIGLGGGSAMDCAKGINFVLTNGGRMEDYWGFGKATSAMLPSIGVPTTAGTGSEAQSFALITDPESHRKMACGDTKARFAEVLLDAELAATAPREVVATAGIDALSHAVESFVTRQRNFTSSLLARRAWAWLDAAFPRYLASHGEASDRPTGESMLLGAHLAGVAIEVSMLGAAHAAANPLTARFGIVHGAAVAVMLPHVVRFNGEGSEENEDLYRRLSGLAAGEMGSAAEWLARRLENHRQAAGLAGSLSEFAIERSALADLARRASREWTARHNPRPLSEQDFRELYAAAW